MRRVLVIGAPGSGKSTLATRLAAKLGVPVHYLDRHYWKPGWQYRDAADARERVRGIVETPAWVMDGNFSNTFDLRMPRADSVIWLDYPRATCIRRVDAKLLRWVWDFPAKHRPEIPKAIARYGTHLNVVRLADDRDVAEFLRTVEAA